MHLNTVNILNRVPIVPAARNYVHAVPELDKPACDVAAVAADAAPAAFRGKLLGDQTDFESSPVHVCHLALTGSSLAARNRLIVSRSCAKTVSARSSRGGESPRRAD